VPLEETIQGAGQFSQVELMFLREAVLS